MSFKISIIIPCYNEEDNLKDFYCGIKRTLLALPYSYEIIFVNDGSNDNSSNLLDEIKTKDIAIKVINLDKKRGQLNAYLTGFGYAEGEIIITMDADGQHEPNDISAFIEKINAGSDFVSGYRVNRNDPFDRKALSLIANYLISAKTGIKLHDWGCGFNAFNRNLIFSLKTYKQNKIFLIKPLLASMTNAVGEINIAHYPRQKGNSKYNILSIIKFGLKFLLNGAVNYGGKMRKTQIGCIILIMLIFSSTNILRAEPINKNGVTDAAVTAFTQYCLALSLEDYDWAFSLEPRFMQETAGSVKVYKNWWSLSTEYDKYRRLYSTMEVKKIKILTPKRAVILADSPDGQLTNAAFYIFPEDGEWKIGYFEHVLKHTKEDLERLKDSIKQFYNKNGKLPENLSELSPEYITILPIDLFNDKEETYHYVKGQNENFIIYSFGPDSDDDLGIVEYDYNNGLLSNGDFIIKN